MRLVPLLISYHPFRFIIRRHWLANYHVLYRWIAHLQDTFKENGLEKVAVDRRKFAKEISTLLLDTWMMSTHEISVNVLDKLGGGRGDIMRGYIEEVGKNRQNTAFNLERVITVGRKPLR